MSAGQSGDLIPIPQSPGATRVRLDPALGSVTLCDVTISSPELLERLELEKGDNERIKKVCDFLLLGFEVLKRSQVSSDVDFIERRFEKMSAGFERVVEDQLRSTFDPQHEMGHLARLLMKVAEFERKVSELFNPEDRTSYLGRMNERMGEVFDPERGTLPVLLDSRLSFERSDSPFQRFREEVKDQLGSLRKEIEGYKTALLGEVKLVEERERGTKKGFTFEDEVEQALGLIAKTLGDEVERCSLAADGTGSKKGDFVVTFSDTRGRLVIDTKDEEMTSLPKWKETLEAALVTRKAGYALLLARDPAQLQAQVGCFQEYEGRKLITALPSLEIAIKWARLRTRALHESGGGLDVSELLEDLEQIQSSLDAVVEMRKHLTAIGTSRDRIETQIKKLEDGIKIALGKARDCVKGPAPVLPNGSV